MCRKRREKRTFEHSCVMAGRADQDLLRVLLGDRHLECLIYVYLRDILSAVSIEANLVETQGGNPFPLRHFLHVLPHRRDAVLAFIVTIVLDVRFTRLHWCHVDMPRRPE
ncbi:Uncharacterised protein [Mycobacteroides abscessus]|nr:Uncharacterised protein [Mycobacteroides abscessus]